MLVNQDTVPVPNVCGNCRIDTQLILHNVRHRGIFRRLCTSCVLRLHPHSFCPTCFTVYQSSQPPVAPNGVVTCVKCYSVSHSTCVGLKMQSRYLCPMCVNLTAPIFVLKNTNAINKVIDIRAANILLAAAMISSVSMSEAEMAAKAVAERRAKEAATTRKRATQALEYMAALAAKEKVKMNQSLAGSGMGVSMSRFGGIVGRGLMERGDGYGYGYSGALNGRIDVAGVRIEDKKQVIRALNGVELKENKRLGGVGLQGSGVSEISSIDGVAMVVDEQRVLSSGSGLEVGDLTFQDHNGLLLTERSGDPAKLQDGDTRRESVSDGVVLNPPRHDWMEYRNPVLQCVESTTDPAKNQNGSQQ